MGCNLPPVLLGGILMVTMGANVVLLAFAGLFVFAAFSKLLGRGRFVTTLGSYRLVPYRAAPALSWVVIAGEIGGAALTMMPDPWRRVGLAIFTVIALGGAVLTVVDLATGHAGHPCGCLGDAASAELRWWHPVRATVVALLALSLAILPGASTLPPPISLLLVPISASVWAAVFAAFELAAKSPPAPYESRTLDR